MIQTGQILNETYEITERLGSGAGGIIFKAYHRRMKKYVAVKLIKEEIKGAFDNRSEVDVLKNLKHEYLPQVLDFIEDGSDVYTVMEFIEGQDLKQLITGGRHFDEKSVRKYALQLCEAARYLHSQQPPIIHSDIKPANIMLTPQDDICLIDFNISMMTNSGTAAAIGGSRGFAAPEQFKRAIEVPVSVDEFHEETRFMDNDDTEILPDSAQTASRHVSLMQTKNMARAFIDIRTDIYGIGASIYYILTCRTPTAGRLDFRGVKCSPMIKEVIAKAMNPDPSKRYRNAAEMIKALQSKVSVKMVAAPAATVCAAALCVGVAVFAVSGRTAQPPSENRTAEVTAGTIASSETITVPDSPAETISETGAPGSGSENSKAVTEAETTSGTAETASETTTEATTAEAFVTIKGEQYATDIVYVNLYLSGKGLTDEDVKLLNKLRIEGTLDLSNNQITTPGTLGWLGGLRELNLSNNQIANIESLSGFPLGLTHLDLSNNQISDIRPLRSLTGLTHLDLSNNPVSNISTLGRFTELTELSLYGTGLSDISILSGLKNLEMLNISANQISDISVLSGLANLKELYMFTNQISDISAVSGLKNLERLTIDRNQISDISVLSGLTNLKELSMSTNQISDISAISGLKNLEILYVRNNQISDISPVSGLVNLKELYIEMNYQITDISMLSSLTNLTFLELSESCLDMDDIIALGEALPNCFIFANY